MFKTGDKVVCIDDSPCKCGCGERNPIKEGCVYVVEWINHRSHCNGKPLIGIKLIGVNAGSPSHPGQEVNQKRLRLLDELKQEARKRQEQSV